MKNNIKTIAFDADDTLWVNETYFQEAENELCKLLEDYLPAQSVSEELFKTEMKNLPLYGYGAKGFMLSMIETAARISNNTVPAETIAKIIRLGQGIIEKPVELLDGVVETLKKLNGRYNLVVATKGDLLHQEQKLKKSGLEPYFHHIEIMSDKSESDYEKLLKHLDCRPGNFLMIGNSMRSDILPVLNLGASAAHIPYHVTWAHEQHEHELKHDNFYELEHLSDILNYL